MGGSCIKPGVRDKTAIAQVEDTQANGIPRQNLHALIYCEHGAKEYHRVNPDGSVTHVNGLENFWKHLKGGINGTHIHVSKKHLHKYAKEWEFRFNHRENPSVMFPALVSTFPKPQP
jgi:hypothetical protein